MESIRGNGKTRQKVIRYTDREVEGKLVRRMSSAFVTVTAVMNHLDIEITNRIASDLKIGELKPRDTCIGIFVNA